MSIKKRPFTAVFFGTSLGFFAAMNQILFIREFLVVRGASELSLGIVLFHWLLFISTGALLAPKMKPSPVQMSILALIGAPLICGALLMVRHYEALFALSPGAFLSTQLFFVLAMVGLLPAATLSGYFFSAAAFLVGTQSVVPVSKLYIGEAVGAAVSGVLFAFVLSELMTPLPLILLAATLLGVGVQILARGFWGKVIAKRFWLVPTALLLMFISSLFLGVDNHSLALAFHHQASRGQLAVCEETGYSRLCIGKNLDQYQLYRDGRLDYIFPDPYDRPTPVHFALGQHKHPQKVLLLGGGVPNRVDAALSHNVDEIHYLYSDNEEHQIIAPFFSAQTVKTLASERVHFHGEPPRPFLQQNANTYDVIVMFGSPPRTAAQNSFHTVSFFKAVGHALSKDGVFVIATPGSANVMSSPAVTLLANQRQTLLRVFERVHFFMGVQTFWVATNGEMTTTDAAQMETRLAERNPELKEMVNYFDFLNPEKNRTALGAIEKVSPTANTDDKPAGFVHTLALQRLARSATVQAPTKPSRISDRMMLILSIGVSVLLFGGLFFLFQKKPGGAPHGVSEAVGAIATTGMCGMGLQIVLLYVFSVKIGGLYQHIAWLLSVFMLGLAGGAYGGKRVGSSSVLRLIADIGVLAALGLAGWILQWTHIPVGVFGVLVLIAGGVTGFSFPIFLSAAASVEIIKAPAFMEGADHIGAALGAVVTALVWLPQLGVTWTCVLLSLFKVPLIVKNVGKIVHFKSE